MSVLSTIQGLANKIGVARPNGVFGSTEREHQELADTANETARYVSEQHEWQLLKRLYTITGNGVDDVYGLPDDYDRLPKDQRVWSSRMLSPLEGPVPHDEWLGRQVRDYTGFGAWTLLGGEMAFNPVLDDGETAKFYYMTNERIEASDTTLKAEFTADDDLYRLDERLLRQGIIWRWREQKGMPYAEALADFEKLLADRIMNDQGPKIIRVGGSRLMRDVTVAYPWTLGQ